MNAWKAFLGLPASNNYFFCAEKLVKKVSNFRMTKFGKIFQPKLREENVKIKTSDLGFCE